MLLKISHSFDLQICKELLGSNQDEPCSFMPKAFPRGINTGKWYGNSP